MTVNRFVFNCEDLQRYTVNKYVAIMVAKTEKLCGQALQYIEDSTDTPHMQYTSRTKHPTTLLSERSTALEAGAHLCGVFIVVPCDLSQVGT